MKYVIHSWYGGYSLSREIIAEILSINPESAALQSYTEEEMWGDYGVPRQWELAKGYKDIYFTSGKESWRWPLDVAMYKDKIYMHASSYDICEMLKIRSDPTLISVLESEKFKDVVDQRHLKIVEVPDDVDVYIDVFDGGNERVSEIHRTWC